jgi:anti-anti-sigma factor
MTPDVQKPLRIFCSYSHKDEEYLNVLRAWLRGLERRGQITWWHDREIVPGWEWEEEIDKNLRTADIILLLVTSDFMASDYVFEREIDRAIERHKRGEARVIPIIVRPALWKGTSLDRLQALPKDAKPITTWLNRDEAWLDVVEGIQKAVEELWAERQELARPPTVEVPDLSAQGVSQAKNVLVNKGLKFGEQSEVSSGTVPEGHIVEQSPKAGTQVETGGSVSVTISSGPQKATAADSTTADIEREVKSDTKAQASISSANVTIDVRKVSDSVSVIDVKGELTAFAEDVLMQAYNQASERGARTIILNFEGLEYMSGSGTGLLVTLVKAAHREKQQLLIYGLSEHYRSIFQITRLDDAIAIYDSEEEAVRAADSL